MKPFFQFAMVLCVFAALFCYCHAGRDMFNSFGQKVEVPKHMNRLNKRPVKTIKSPDGDIIDCIHIYHQPAFDHPLLKNHTIKMRPSYHPNDHVTKNVSKVGTITQLWQLSGKCPERTIPIRRTNSLGSSMKLYKKNYADQKSAESRKGHEYATAEADGPLFGGKATFNVWNPRVEGPRELSLGQMWIAGGGGAQTIEAGWQVVPLVYKDHNTRFFIYFTEDDYHNTGCYNHKCPCFMQIDNEFVLGGTISPTSQVGGSQYDVTIFIWKDHGDGDWWLKVGDKEIGYWPATRFPQLSEGASSVMFGGEISNDRIDDGRHTTTQMGSSRFPEEGFGKASYIKNIQTVDESRTLNSDPYLTPFVSNKDCYDITMKDKDIDDWETYFFFGGAGRSDRCP